MGCSNAKGQVQDTVAKEGKNSNDQKNDKFVILQENLIKESKGNVADLYEFKNNLGEGGYGLVFLCFQKKLGINRAIKQVNKRKIKGTSMDSLLNEINILKSLDHPNIMKIYEYFNDENYLYVVGELIEGGELFDFICEQGSLEEREAKEIMRQLLSTIFHLHSKKIIHRDIKPENILMTSKTKANMNIKLIDFGISLVHTSEENLSEKIGTPLYVAPEVLSGSYNEKCDEWSAGVLMFTILTGYPPFQSKSQNQKELLKVIKSGVYNKDMDEYQILSAEAKDLISGLLTLDPEQRISAEKAVNHPWFTKNMKGKKNLSVEKKNIVENLQKFRAERKIQLAILFFFAHFLTLEEEKEKLMEMFREIDKDSNGTLSREELMLSVRQTKKLSQIQAENIVSQILNYGDLNKNDKIDYSEFVTATMQREKLLNVQKIETVFSMFDKDGDGQISLAEFKEMFSGKGKIDEETWRSVFLEADENQDNNISLKEFKNMMLKLVNSKP